MNDEEKRGLIMSVLKKHPLGAIATVNENGTAEVAIIGISQNEKLELVFDTFTETRKYRNIARSPNVSFAIGYKDNITIQYEGLATELFAADKDVYEKVLLWKIPGEVTFIHQGSAIFKTTPKWIRYSDFSKPTPEIFEMNF